VLQLIADQARVIAGAEHAAIGIEGSPDHPFDPWVYSGVDPAVAEIPSPDGVPMGERVPWLRPGFTRSEFADRDGPHLQALGEPRARRGLGQCTIPDHEQCVRRRLGANRRGRVTRLDCGFVRAVGAIAEAKVLGGQSVIPITHDIALAFTYSQNWPLGSALAVLLMLVVGTLVVLALRRFDLDTFLGRR